MNRMPWRCWLPVYAAPALLFLGSLGLIVLVWGDGDGPVMTWGFIVGPAIALLTGFLFRPTQVWIAPAVTSLVIASWVIVATLSFDYDGGRPLAMQYVWALLFFGLPYTLLTWLGSVARAAVNARRQDQRHTPHAPAR